jgi:hypothetical protein
LDSSWNPHPALASLRRSACALIPDEPTPPPGLSPCFQSDWCNFETVTWRNLNSITKLGRIVYLPVLAVLSFFSDAGWAGPFLQPTGTECARAMHPRDRSGRPIPGGSAWSCCMPGGRCNGRRGPRAPRSSSLDRPHRGDGAEGGDIARREQDAYDFRLTALIRTRSTASWDGRRATCPAVLCKTIEEHVPHSDGFDLVSSGDGVGGRLGLGDGQGRRVRWVTQP